MKRAKPGIGFAFREWMVAFLAAVAAWIVFASVLSCLALLVATKMGH